MAGEPNSGVGLTSRSSAAAPEETSHAVADAEADADMMAPKALERRGGGRGSGSSAASSPLAGSSWSRGGSGVASGVGGFVWSMRGRIVSVVSDTHASCMASSPPPPIVGSTSVPACSSAQWVSSLRLSVVKKPHMGAGQCQCRNDSSGSVRPSGWAASSSRGDGCCVALVRLTPPPFLRGRGMPANGKPLRSSNPQGKHVYLPTLTVLARWTSV
mmetsp:Transcript_21762/g.61918  ORF Transcript_21762/g.61918 Transcript_21762/m.61918 type:complete len:215 (+) Transcript_21762:745-1389(+)